MAASGACKRTRRALLLLLAAATGVAALGRRHTTLWINTQVPADIAYAEQHAEALTRVIPAYGCWRIADNGSHSGIAPECGPQTLGGLHQKGIELWPEVGISKKSIVSGSWRPALARNGTLGPMMREWGWKGVFLDEEEPQNTPLCRKSRCGDPEKHCPACTPQVSAAQYATFLAEFSAALKVYGLGLQIFVGMDAPVRALPPTPSLRVFWLFSSLTSVVKLRVAPSFLTGGMPPSTFQRPWLRLAANLQWRILSTTGAPRTSNRRSSLPGTKRGASCGS